MSMYINLPDYKRKILDSIVFDLSKLEQVAAVVLGGSHCTGMATAESDLDIGIYYHIAAPFGIDAVGEIARKYHVGDGLTVTDFYQWGAWVNGGAWISTEAGELDCLYRNIEQVQAVIEKSKNGIWEKDYEQQPPYGFSSVIYLAETHYCLPLYDPQEVIKDLKASISDYPPRLKATIIQQALWAAEFTLWQAEKFASKADMYNAIGCFTRALKNIVEALLALNEVYAMGDKHAIALLAHKPACPAHLAAQIEDILSVSRATLSGNAQKLRQLFEAVRALAGDGYQPYFVL